MSTNHTPTRVRRCLAAGGAMLALASAGLACSAHNAREAASTAQALDRIATATAKQSTATAKPPCDGQIVTVIADEPTDCDVKPPQVLVVRWPGSDGIEEDKFLTMCDDMGGELLWTATYNADGEFACEGVDY